MNQPENKPSTAQAASSAASSKKSLAVLLIDDNEADQKLTTILLGQAWSFQRDMEVVVAADGAQALLMLRETRFAFVVLDWKLPIVGGGEVLRTMRRNGWRVPVIVLSALARDQIRDDLEGQAAVFLSKDDMSASTLRQAIGRSLQLLGLTEPPSQNLGRFIPDPGQKPQPPAQLSI